MNVIKRNGVEEKFTRDKIKKAISKANRLDNNNRLPEGVIEWVTDNVVKKIEEFCRTLSVEEIQDIVENELLNIGERDLAKKYINYRYVHNMMRQTNSTDGMILSLLELNNEEIKQENSNKNPIINSVQRDYMAGEVSKDITKRFLLPDYITEAHKEGIIHFHDADYFAQHMHNCFSPDTVFLTKSGGKKFSDFSDGDEVEIKDLHGVWRKATVHSYGEQRLQRVELINGNDEIVVFDCTPNHRWILVDSTVTTSLKEGDELFRSNNNIAWTVTKIEDLHKSSEVWCVEEPATNTFTLEAGVITGNCCLINLEDMLQNGTVISEVMIEKPHSFYTACTIATQGIAQVASSQYGGQSVTLSHLAPFVDVSRQKLRAEVREEMEKISVSVSDEQVNAVAEKRLKKEIARGIQTIQYQIITLMTTNGQAPFVTIFMYLNEVPEGRMRDDLAMLIEEMLKQRHLGVKNEKGIYITPAFPKLIYVLEENNITEDSKYWYLTELAAVCTAKRLVPDYISEKKMLELKIDKKGEGHCYPCMGCVEGSSFIKYQAVNGLDYEESFREAWNRLSSRFPVEKQPNGKDEYMDVSDLEIWDNKLCKYVQLRRIIRNTQSDWRKVSFDNGSSIDVTADHPFEVIARGTVLAKDIKVGDKMWYGTFCSNEIKVTKIDSFNKEQYSYDVTTESEHFMVDGIYSHNCRSFLTPYRDEDDKPKYYGRFNQGVVTLNLVDIACSSERDEEKFWRIFDERLEICHEALLCRHKRLLGTPSDVAPILWQYGALARLKKGEVIDKLLFNGYSTISLGYAGLCECVRYMKGVSHTDPSATPFALEVMKHLNDACAKWRAEHNIDFSLYGTPLESTTYRFAKCLQKRWGIIEGVTDKPYITNSYHVHVTEDIDAFEKITFEAQFQHLSPGGAITYVETPDMQNNIEAVLAIIKHIYEHIIYAELNTKSDYCMACGYDGEIKTEYDENEKLIWKCPNCGNTDQRQMSVARRTCGYIGTQFWNQGRTKEIADRVLHI